LKFINIENTKSCIIFTACHFASAAYPVSGQAADISNLQGENNAGEVA